MRLNDLGLLVHLKFKLEVEDSMFLECWNNRLTED